MTMRYLIPLLFILSACSAEVVILAVCIFIAAT